MHEDSVGDVVGTVKIIQFDERSGTELENIRESPLTLVPADGLALIDAYLSIVDRYLDTRTRAELECADAYDLLVPGVWLRSPWTVESVLDELVDSKRSQTLRAESMMRGRFRELPAFAPDVQVSLARFCSRTSSGRRPCNLPGTSLIWASQNPELARSILSSLEHAYPDAVAHYRESLAAYGH